MRTQSQDTSEVIERMMIEGHRRFSSIERFQRIRALTGSIATMHASSLSSRADLLRQRYGLSWMEDSSTPKIPAFDIQPTLHSITSYAHECQVSVALTGGIACCLYGFPRTIRDIDFLMESSTAELLFQRFSQIWIPISCNSLVWSVIDPMTLVKVDFMTTHGQIPCPSLLARRQRFMIDEEEFLDVLSAEDVILTRLAWYHQQGTSPDDQWNDLMGIVKIHAPFLDRLYLHVHAHQLHCERLLDQLFSDCDERIVSHAESNGYSNHHWHLESNIGSL